MKVLLRRDQKAGMMGMGKIIFILEVRAELTADEQDKIKKYKLGDTVLYERTTLAIGGTGLLGMAGRLAHRMVNLSLSVSDLENGKRVECKDIVEMLAAEQQIKEAAQTFKNVLDAAAHFGGEEVLEI